MKKRKYIFFGVVAMILSLLFGMSGMAGNNPYIYNETSQNSVTVYVTIASDGLPIIGSDENATVLANLPVTVEYFDLANYEMTDFDGSTYTLAEEYYRYPTDKEDAYYKYASTNPEDVIQRPTMLHLYITLLEKYYLGLDEASIGQGLVPLDQAGFMPVYNIWGEEAYAGECAALQVGGGSRSIYMNSFWGYGCNLNYYINHEYPLQWEGWGATSDYILLEDGDVIDLAMFNMNNWYFYNDEAFGFLYFPHNQYKVAAGETLTLDTLYRATSRINGECITEHLEEDYSSYQYFSVDGEGTIDNWYMGNSAAEFTFDTPGTYKIYATDPRAGVENMNSTDEYPATAPAVATVTVTANETKAVSKAEFTDITVPAAGNTLDTEASCVSAGVEKQTLTWTVNGVAAAGVAQYNTVYTANITAEAADGYTFEGIDKDNITVNGKKADAVVNTDGTLTVTYTFDATAKAKLLSVTEPAAITGIMNGTDLSADAMNLPKAVSISTEDTSVITAPVTWDLETLAAGTYDPAVITEQTFTLNGTVEVPGTIDVNDVEITVQIQVTVSADEDALKEQADQAAADAVAVLINAIGSVEYTDVCKTNIEAARTAYDELTDDQKARVTAEQLAVLTKAESDYAALKQAAEDAAAKEAADQAAADAVIAKINIIGTVEYTDTCKTNIEAARAAYDALTADQKARVTEDQLAVLTTAETAYAALKQAAEDTAAKEAADKAVADAVIAKINAIGTAAYTDASKAKIEAARAAYDALTADQKAIVGDKLNTLTAAEKSYADLKKAAEDKAAADAAAKAEAEKKAAEDKAAADAVVTKINAIGTAAYTADSKAKIDTARTAYDALTADQKALVGDKLNTLTAAEKSYADLKKAAEDKAAADAAAKEEADKKAAEDKNAADAVIVLIDAIGTVDATDASKEKIDAAKAAYDALTADQKALVAAEKVTVLTNAETTYSAMVEALTAPKLEQAKATQTSITVTWAVDQKATDGYRIYIKGGKYKKYTKVKDVAAGSTSYTIQKVNGKKLVKGTKYDVKIVALQKENKKTVELGAQKLKTVTATAKPVIDSAKRSKNGKSVTLKWNKVSGANGYEIQMSTKAKSGFKKAANVASKKTSYTKKSLKASRTYYFRMRTYKTVNGEKFYSSWSKVKKVSK